MDEGLLLADRYRLTRPIAAGGMADVWAAVDERLQRTVAVKVVRLPDPELAARLQREARLLAQLEHPGVVRLFDAGSVDDRPYLVMELVEGMSLHDRLVGEGQLDPAEAAELGAAVAGALAEAHAKGIVHRDVKPANVLVEAGGRARLADFGIAQPRDASRLTQPGLAVGTVAYVAPEQLSGEEVGPPADVYALGLVLLEALTGEPAFAGTGSEAAVARLDRDPDLPLDLPEPFAPLLTAMTSRDPSARPTAAEVATALAVGFADDAAAAVPVAPMAEELRRSPRRAMVAAAAAALVAVGIVAAATWPGGGSSDPEPATQEAPSTTAGLPSAEAETPVSDPTAAVPTTVSPFPDPGAVDPGSAEVSDQAPAATTPPVVDQPVTGVEPDPQEPPPTTDTTVASDTAGSSST